MVARSVHCSAADLPLRTGTERSHRRREQLPRRAQRMPEEEPPRSASAHAAGVPPRPERRGAEAGEAVQGHEAAPQVRPPELRPLARVDQERLEPGLVRGLGICVPAILLTGLSGLCARQPVTEFH